MVAYFVSVHNCVQSVSVGAALGSRFLFCTDGYQIDYSTFYKSKNHQDTESCAEKLLLKISLGNDSDIGESDEETEFDTDNNEASVEEEAAMEDLEASPAAESPKDLRSVSLDEPAVPLTRSNMKWKKCDDLPERDRQFLGVSTHDMGDCEATSLEYFSRDIPEFIFAKFSEATNVYSVRQTLSNISSNPAEIRKLFGMHIMVGVNPLSRVRLYWDSTLRNNPMADTMSEKRFFKLRNNLHITVDAFYTTPIRSVKS